MLRGFTLQERKPTLSRHLSCSASPNTMPKNNHTKALDAARHMPPLFHTLPGEEYSDAKSEVLNWLWSQPAVRDATFQFYKHNRAIVYETGSGKWRGAATPSTFLKPVEPPVIEHAP